METDPFGWLRECMTKPIVHCVGCRRPYYPHMGNCFQCEDTPIVKLYLWAEQQRMNDEFWQRWQERHMRHG